MRTYLLALLVLVCACGGADSLRAQAQDTPEARDDSSPIALSEAGEPAWYEEDGSLDAVFGDLLVKVAYIPFFNLTGQSSPAYPWQDANGQPVDKAAHEAYQSDLSAIRSGTKANPHPEPWTDGNGDRIDLGPKGEANVTSLPFVVVWLVIAAIFFTLMMRFVNLRMFTHAIRVVSGKYSNPDDHGEVTHFQALSSALSATVGLGNIAGVAVAVSLGGPGATVWMIVAGLLGMTLKFTECTLGQRYRDIDEHGRVRGGPMRYLKRGLEEKGFGALGSVLAVMFAVFCIGGSLAGGNSFQVSQSLTIAQSQIPFLQDNPWAYGLVMAVFVGVVIIGGIRRIAVTASKIVPTMCALYVTGCLLVLVAYADQIPAAFGSMFAGAFSGEAIYGGAIGSLIMGFKRAAFSNEAGVGSASIAHSAAKTEYPVREGIVALLEPFIDTVVVCTMTALVIVITGVYNDPQYTDLIVGEKGAALTEAAFSSVGFMAGWFPYVLLVAVVLFAFSTMISWSYYGERCWTGLFGDRSSIIYKLLFLVFVFLGSVIGAKNVLEFGDLMILIMAFPNILGLYFLGGVVKSELIDYQQKLDAGEFRSYE